MKAPRVPVPCDVKDCKTEWIVVIYIRDEKAVKTVKRSVKLCATHYKECQTGKSPTLRG